MTLANEAKEALHVIERRTDQKGGNAAGGMGKASRFPEGASADIQQSASDALRSVENKISDGRKKLDELKQSGEDNIDSLRKQLSDLVGPDDKR